MKAEPGSYWTVQDVGDVRAMGCLPGQVHTESRTSPRKRSVFQSTVLEGVKDLKNHLSPLISDIELQDLEFCPSFDEGIFLRGILNQVRGRWASVHGICKTLCLVGVC